MLNISIWNILAVFSSSIAIYMLLRAIRQDKPKKPISGWLHANEYYEANQRFNLHIDDVIELFGKHAKFVYDKLIIATVGGIDHKIPVIRLPILLPDIPQNLFPIDLDTQKDTSSLDDDLLRFRKEELGQKITDNPTFRLTALQQDKLVIGLSTYFKTLSTSDIHYNKFIANMPSANSIQNNKELAFEHYASLPFFKNWLQQIEKIICHQQFSGYTASIGCSVLTLFKTTENHYCFYAVHNSSEKNGGLDGHVIPSFMYQPITSNIAYANKELDIKEQVLREFGEEILGIEDLESPNAGTLKRILKKATSRISSNQQKTPSEMQLEELNKLFEMQKANLYVTGIVLDVFRLRPEVTLLLFIDDPEYMSDIEPKGSWETKNKKVNKYNINQYENFLKRDTSVPDLCVPGMAALINGMEYAKTYIFTTNTNKEDISE